mmetsp:Transcript_27030/g.42207  ORF Transcript_27030/g.42207 Transcript_27030/m.42207 type:complete len:281 (-) Transcript_27030:401-1243(-)
MDFSFGRPASCPGPRTGLSASQRKIVRFSNDIASHHYPAHHIDDFSRARSHEEVRGVHTVEELERFLSSNSLFSCLTEIQCRQIAQKMEMVQVKPGITVQRAGRPAVRLFVVVSGVLEKSIKGRVVKVLHTNEIFGDIMSLDHHAKTVSEVASLSACKLLTIHIRDFHHILQANTTLLRSLQGLPPKSGQRGKDNLMELIGQGPVKFSDAAEQHHGPHSASSSRSASPPVRGPGAHKLERSSSAPIQSNESQHHHLEGRAESVHGIASHPNILFDYRPSF